MLEGHRKPLQAQSRKDGKNHLGSHGKFGASFISYVTIKLLNRLSYLCAVKFKGVI
jgi:hypothetical protein